MAHDPVDFRLPGRLARALAAWAEAEGMTLDTLAERIVIAALRRRHEEARDQFEAARRALEEASAALETYATAGGDTHEVGSALDEATRALGRAAEAIAGETAPRDTAPGEPPGGTAPRPRILNRTPTPGSEAAPVARPPESERLGDLRFRPLSPRRFS